MADTVQGTVTRKYTVGAQTLGNNAITVSSSASLIVAQDVAASTPDQELSIAIPKDNMKMLAFECTVACTVETNSPTVDTFTLAANKPLGWDDSEAGDIFLTVDVTSLFITVPGASAGVFKIVGIMDVTP